MTLGQRIAQKRKELGLSQEGLGEQLGVSRQAIYKWESDASLPEIDKLITLSKIFSVSVGWLLGVEEEASPQQQENSGELTETQLQMVREIVDGYLAAQPKPASPRRRKLLRLCGAAAVLALAAVLFSLFSKLDQVNRDFGGLYLSVNNISSNVNSQISSITGRVESILKSQNNLMAEWSAQLASTDLWANTAAFDIRVVPRTYVEGMTAVFMARSGEDTTQLPVEAGTDGSFSGRLTCPLTDDITLSAVLITGDKRETQQLNGWTSLYSDTFPILTIENPLWFEEDNGVLPDQISTEHQIKSGTTIENADGGIPQSWYPTPPATLQLGLFQDRKLLMWYEGGMEVTNRDRRPTEEYVWRRPQAVTLEPGHEYCNAAVYTDAYGRQQIYCGSGLAYNESHGHWEPSAPYAGGLTDWEF